MVWCAVFVALCVIFGYGCHWTFVGLVVLLLVWVLVDLVCCAGFYVYVMCFRFCFRGFVVLVFVFCCECIATRLVVWVVKFLVFSERGFRCCEVVV